MLVEQDDLKLMLAEVGRFARERVATATARFEVPIDHAVLDQLSQEAVELGILSTSTGDGGFGIWERTDQAESMAFNLGALRQLGWANAGVAFAWHRMALARSAAEQVKLALDATSVLGTTLVSTGHYGLSRTSAARWLNGSTLHEDDVALLADWLDRKSHATTVIAPRTWRSLLWPVWRDGRMAWQLMRRDALDVQPCRAQHGLDELSAFLVRDESSVSVVPLLDDGASRVLFGRALKMDMMGLLAIAAGALARGQELAAGYASMRRQGGKYIGEHVAVQRMLSDIEVARQNADVTLASLARPLDEIDAGSVAAMRISAHALLCDAANQVMQVHGGMGYMREAGPEKLVRDQNMLKLQAGGTLAARSFVAGCIGASA